MAKKLSYRTVAEIKTDADSDLIKLNESVENNDFEGVTSFTADLTEHVKELNGALTHYSFVSMSQTENPLMTAIEMRHVKRYKVSAIKEDDIITGYKLEEGTGVLNFLDFAKFCKDRKITCGTGNWVVELQRFAILLTLHELGDLTTAKKSSKMLKVTETGYAKKILADFASKSKDEVSKTDLTKELQNVIDAMVYIPVLDKKGEEVNQVKASSRSASFIVKGFTKRSNKFDGYLETSRLQTLAYDVAVVISKILAKDDEYGILYEGYAPKDMKPNVTIATYADSDPDESNDSKESD